MGDQKVRELYYSDEFADFIRGLDRRVREKYIWTIHIVETVRDLPTKYVKKIVGTEFFEMRVSVGHNEYRTVIFATDSDNFTTATRIYILNSFLKKSTNDYKKQLKIAERILKELEDECE